MAVMLSKFDEITGICTYRTSKGTYVQLNNGMTGFILNAFLRKGLAVLCSVMYIKEDENFLFLRLDSVDYDAVA